jgi:hypothetical protein
VFRTVISCSSLQPLKIAADIPQVCEPSIKYIYCKQITRQAFF